MTVATRHGLKIFKWITDFWEERAHALTGLEITSVDFQGQHGLVGTTQGVYASHDEGENWILDSDGIDTPHIRWIRIHPHDSRYFFVGTEPANIFTKMAEDEKWRKAKEVSVMRERYDWYMPYSPNPGCVRGFAFHDNLIYASVEVGGLLVSKDYGTSWNLVPGSSGQPRQSPHAGEIHPDVHSVATNPSSPGFVAAPTGGGFFISKDAGSTWMRKYDAYCRAVWVDPDHSDHMILGPADGVGKGGRIERTTDGGETWALMMGNLEEKWPQAMVERFVTFDDQIFAVLSNGKILTAKIGPFSWQYLLPNIGNVLMIAFS
jgi:photosystem II stability/assembly factor-like uncharacterized protein